MASVSRMGYSLATVGQAPIDGRGKGGHTLPRCPRTGIAIGPEWDWDIRDHLTPLDKVLQGLADGQKTIISLAFDHGDRFDRHEKRVDALEERVGI